MMERIVQRFLYFPERIAVDEPPPSYCGDVQEVWMESDASDRIHGLFWPAPKGRPTIAFFHGNAQAVYLWALVREDLAAMDCGMLLIDYPGYGKSSGRPTEQGLYASGRVALSWLNDRQIPNERIVVFGKSLGGGVSIEVARNRRLCGLVLESTFTSIPAVAARLLPMLPHSLIFSSERYASIEKVSAVSCPVLVIHGTSDKLIRVTEGKTLYENANPPKKLFLVEGAGHNNVALRAGTRYGATLRQWLDTVLSGNA